MELGPHLPGLDGQGRPNPQHPSPCRTWVPWGARLKGVCAQYPGLIINLALNCLVDNPPHLPCTDQFRGPHLCGQGLARISSLKTRSYLCMRCQDRRV